ncbi:hypothetical protein JTF08_04820 [Micrococcaceae bacterium RIT802]|nr:hypothetical protein [Micrococcaceae bacterium RIT 802]
MENPNARAEAPTLRIARPTRDLHAARGFWVDAVGMETLWGKPDDEHGPALLMAGFPGAGWHLELVLDPAAVPATEARSVEEQLVLYLGREPQSTFIDALVAAGGRIIEATGYWQRWGTTLIDPDGYRLVLSSRTWDG